MRINISRIHYPVTSLGPGKRLAIWFQGCTLKCKGCISVDTWEHGTGETTIDELMHALRPLLRQVDGITISGGEPFEQFDALLSLLKSIKAEFAANRVPDLGTAPADSFNYCDVLVYSGMEFEALKPKLELSAGLIDALITGPFEIDSPQTLPWRGSDNQTLHKLTPLGQARFADGDNPAKASFNSLDIMFDDESTLWIAGIPKRGDLKNLLDLLASQDIHAISTEQTQRRQADTCKT